MTALLAAAATLAERFGYSGSVATYRPPALSGGKRSGTMAVNLASVTMHILMPTRAPDRQLLAAIGGERSTKFGWCAAGTDIKAGDEVRYGSIVYAVTGVEQTPHMAIVALAEIQPKGQALA